MNRKFLTICMALVCSFLLLTGCAMNSTEETVAESGPPADAIFPVMADGANGIKSNKIDLTDFTLTLPEGYVYGKVDYEEAGYTTYYVWQDKKNKEYSFELDADIMLYIYDGLDVNSPHREINKAQALASIKTGYMNYFANLVTLRNRMTDAEVCSSDDGRYYTFCFTGNSGEYITTTYSDMCYPKTYYGIYTMEVKTNDSDRQYYGFIFSNDSQGEIFKQSEYENLLEQIKQQFNISKFYSLPNADQALDYSNGKSYKQLVADVLYEKEGTNYIERGTFYNSLLYYIEATGRGYVRKNVDGSKSQAAAAATEPDTEETAETLETIEGTYPEGQEPASTTPEGVADSPADDPAATESGGRGAEQ